MHKVYGFCSRDINVHRVMTNVGNVLVWSVKFKGFKFRFFWLACDLNQHLLMELAWELDHGTSLLLEWKTKPKYWKKILNINFASIGKQVNFCEKLANRLSFIVNQSILFSCRFLYLCHCEI